MGPLQVGGSFYQGTGLTLIVPIFNTPILTDQNNNPVLRKGLGFAGMASLTFGGTKIAGGAGVSQLKLTPSEMEPYSHAWFLPSSSSASRLASTRRSSNS